MLEIPILIFFVAIFSGLLFLALIIRFFKRRRDRAKRQFYTSSNLSGNSDVADDGDLLPKKKS